MNKEPFISKINRIVDSLAIDLAGKVVLTEAATGAYVVTPIIAAIAGAKVFAFTKDTKYGSILEVEAQTLAIAEKLGVTDNIQIISKLDAAHIAQANIITNSGHLRPLTRELLQNASSNAVVSYMFEDWEFRSQDIDLAYCRERGIKVISTNERHSKIDVFHYLGELAIKQIHDAGKCVSNNSFLVLSNNPFGPYIANALSKFAESVGVFDHELRKDNYSNGVDWLGDFESFHIPEKYSSAEAVVFTAYPFTHNWFGVSDVLNHRELLRLDHPLILRFAGDIDLENLKTNSIPFYPEVVRSGHMGILLSDIGYDAVIRLQAGGLKAAQLAIENQLVFDGEIIGNLL